ncbi:CoA-binding protein [Robiginitalea marina]|uniref:CoA-binding protein n=1 Tax=Robiginitalea marina TaxID=2954105 RepID=A0ABT1AZL5_9FLAO|nr:CoA-binding protein [Robiginitalea marina]MCO5725493.1 CoA-binding protein [Robiginitalea marina]
MKKTLVFGASVKPHRYSYIAIRRLVDAGVETVAFGLREGTVKGVAIQTSLRGFTGIHTVTLYMRPSRQVPFYGEILRLQPKRVIFNPGTENPEFYTLLRKEGVEVLEACTLVMLSMGQY